MQTAQTGFDRWETPIPNALLGLILIANLREFENEFLKIKYLSNIDLENANNYSEIKQNFIKKINKNIPLNSTQSELDSY